MSEYTWNELDGGEVEMAMNGHKYYTLAGPEPCLGANGKENWWAPGCDEHGTETDLYFERMGIGLTESFLLISAEAACLEGE